MYFAIILVFVLGYLFIAMEHTIHIDKAASALLTGTICWVLFIFGREVLLPEMVAHDSIHFITESLREHLGDIAGIFTFYLIN